MLESTDDPVVERPEADSKKASIKFGIAPDITYGSDDIAEAAIQQNETIRKPSLILNGTGEGLTNFNINMAKMQRGMVTPVNESTVSNSL